MTLRLSSPLDMHIHFRDEEMLKLVAPLTAKTFSGALIMPNLVPPITTKKALLSYIERIKEATKEQNDFEAFVTLFFQADYSYEFLKDIKDSIIGIIDGDDCLVGSDCFSKIHQFHSDGFPVVWTANEWDLNGMNHSGPMDDSQDVYHHPWVSSHFRTFKLS